MSSLRKERFRWFSEACIPRALALYILWRRVKTGITHSWWFSTSLVERARCLKHYLHKASTSVSNTVNIPTTAPDADFPKNYFQSNHWQSGFPQLRLQWLLSVASLQATFVVLQGSLTSLKRSHPTWRVTDTHRITQTFNFLSWDTKMSR